MLDIESAINKWRAKYGDQFTVRIFGRYFTFVTKHSDLKKYYNASEEMLSLSRAGQFIVGSAYPENQYLTEYDTIPYIQNILSSHRLIYMSSNIQAIAHDYFNKNNGKFWLENGDEAVVDLFDFFYRLILRTNSMNFISRRVYKDHVEELIKLYIILDVEKNALNPVVHGLKRRLGLKSDRDAAWEHWVRIMMPDIEQCLQMIDDHIEPANYDTVYETVKYAKEELEKRGKPFTPRLVAYFTFTTFFPAQFNTYITAAFVIIEWIRHEHDEIGRRIREEIDRAPPTGEFTIEYLNSMEFVQACIYEVIRLGTDSQLSLRHAGQDVLLSNDKYIPSGNLVAIPVTRAHDLYTNPDKFDPERHLAPRQENKRDPYRVAPFGRGKHPCTGERYVKMQIKVLLIALSKMCEMKIMPESINFEATINRKQLVGLSRPTKPVFVKISKRK
ncbi:unnamed protein product [Didymodactylos carnosus]|uniref:Cytochrome P450 n=1 Tax=Didymodactylos carnosus TaxID=1234261 RepID=A0A814DKK9_9BILA|nr:unnamed protein product [Didymodactylos carnosus]CAF0968930.1 unnamed protein product [Didymodactylos carnosus]CAF3731976.1 unnamed protein product [Didymodactylos carnosus]CAF3740549.1 unnamed protein product [Didymodactylos carnosus]